MYNQFNYMLGCLWIFYNIFPAIFAIHYRMYIYTTVCSHGNVYTNYLYIKTCSVRKYASFFCRLVVSAPACRKSTVRFSAGTLDSLLRYNVEDKGTILRTPLIRSLPVKWPTAILKIPKYINKKYFKEIIKH
jgi:hypothetical protein